MLNPYDIGWFILQGGDRSLKFIPSGKHTKNIKKLWKITFFSWVNQWAIFNSYVNLPEGNPRDVSSVRYVALVKCP